MQALQKLFITVFVVRSKGQGKPDRPTCFFFYQDAGMYSFLPYQGRMSPEPCAKTIGLKLSVVAFFHCVEKVRGRVHFSIVLNFFIAFDIQYLAVFEFKLIGGVSQIFFFD